MEPAATVGDARRRRRIFSSRTILIVVGIVVSALFTYIAVRHAHLSQTTHALAGDDVRLARSRAWRCSSLAFLIRAVRWQSLFPRDQTAAARADRDGAVRRLPRNASCPRAQARLPEPWR